MDNYHLRQGAVDNCLGKALAASSAGAAASDVEVDLAVAVAVDLALVARGQDCLDLEDWP